MSEFRRESLEWLQDEHEDVEDLLYNHKMDISATVFRRMGELGINKTELAERMGVDNAVVTRIISGRQNVTLKTIAKLEDALGLMMDEGFKYYETRRGVHAATVSSVYKFHMPESGVRAIIAQAVAVGNALTIDQGNAA